MMVGPLPDLHELDTVLEMIHDFLISVVVPPLDRIVQLATRNQQPERLIDPFTLSIFRKPNSFFVGNMNVTLEIRHANPKSKQVVQICWKRVQEVAGGIVRLIDERIVTVDNFHTAFTFLNPCDVGVVRPQVAEGSPHVREKFPRWYDR